MALGFWETLLLSVDSVIIYVLYKQYKQKMLTADIIEKVPVYCVGEELTSAVDKSENKCLPYVGLLGITKSLEPPGLSSNADCQSIIHHTDVLQHRSIRFSTGWQDITSKVGSSTKSCRFGLASLETKELLVEVSEPLKSEFLLANLPIIKHLYVPCQQDFLSQGLDVMVGNIVKGHSFTEKILLEDTPIFAVGAISAVQTYPLCSHNLLLTTPLDKHHPFILTTLSRKEVIVSMQNEARFMKFLCYAFTVIGVGISSYIAYKYVKRKWLVFRRWWYYVNDKKLPHADVGVCASTSMASSNNASSCIICLNELRNLVLMPCKHLCICNVCFERLPLPKQCPFCRGSVCEAIHVYVS